MLALRRVLSTQTGVEDEEGENTFHFRCTVPAKVCSLVIDGGNCADVASLSMIEKLGLQLMAYPYPYNIQW